MAKEAEYRNALYMAQRALMHAAKLRTETPAVATLIDEALAEVSRVLDIGRDDANEMVLT